MTDNDFKAAFRKLDRVEPSTDFLAKARGIPLRYPREESFSLWQLFKLPSRLATLAFSATCGLALGYLTLEEETDITELRETERGDVDRSDADRSDKELVAFLNLDGEESLFATSADVEWDSP